MTDPACVDYFGRQMETAVTPRTLAPMLLSLTLAACATTTVGPPAPPAPPPRYAQPAPPPLANIYGRGVYRVHGVRGSCAGQSVALMRDTPRFRERIVALYESTEHALKPVRVIQARSARLGEAGESPLVASTQCDDGGGFEFHNLEAGSYFIIARVRQAQADHPDADYVDLQHVTLDAGETVDVRLAP